jgi:hypothetical protein
MQRDRTCAVCTNKRNDAVILRQLQCDRGSKGLEGFDTKRSYREAIRVHCKAPTRLGSRRNCLWRWTVHGEQGPETPLPHAGQINAI